MKGSVLGWVYSENCHPCSRGEGEGVREQSPEPAERDVDGVQRGKGMGNAVRVGNGSTPHSEAMMEDDGLG